MEHQHNLFFAFQQAAGFLGIVVADHEKEQKSHHFNQKEGPRFVIGAQEAVVNENVKGRQETDD